MLFTKLVSSCTGRIVVRIFYFPELILLSFSFAEMTGKFLKTNEPFKSKIKLLFGDHFKFKWDILHLVNRACAEALNYIQS